MTPGRQVGPGREQVSENVGAPLEQRRAVASANGQKVDAGQALERCAVCCGVVSREGDRSADSFAVAEDRVSGEQRLGRLVEEAYAAVGVARRVDDPDAVANRQHVAVLDGCHDRRTTQDRHDSGEHAGDANVPQSQPVAPSQASFVSVGDQFRVSHFRDVVDAASVIGVAVGQQDVAQLLRFPTDGLDVANHGPPVLGQTGLDQGERLALVRYTFENLTPGIV